ncbi:MAG: TolC family protein, partial [marine benthic group bacterium]|nr:TolC family protein [Gemmatimonadota bacterium]
QRRVEIEQARTEQLLYTYEQSILTAFREVEDAIVATNTYRDEYEARHRQVESATNAAELSWVRYEGGLTSYLEVLDLQRSQFSAELAASQTLQLHLSSIVQLYKALGGGWTVPEQLASAGTGNDAD